MNQIQRLAALEAGSPLSRWLSGWRELVQIHGEAGGEVRGTGVLCKANVEDTIFS